MPIRPAFALPLLLLVTCTAARVLLAQPTQPATAPGAEASPREVLLKFRDALKANDVEGASALVAQFPDVDNADVKRQLATLAKKASGGRDDFDVLDDQARGGCAVVVLHKTLKNGQPESEYDPFYLLERDGAWLILPTGNRWNVPEYKLSDAQTAAFQELETWFQRRRTELQRQQSPNRQRK